MYMHLVCLEGELLSVRVSLQKPTQKSGKSLEARNQASRG